MPDACFLIISIDCDAAVRAATLPSRFSYRVQAFLPRAIPFIVDALMRYLAYFH